MTGVTAKWLKASEFLILQSGLDTDLRYEASALNWSPPSRKAFSWSWLLIGWWRNCQLLVGFTTSLTVQTACRWTLSWTSRILKKFGILTAELMEIAVFLNVMCRLVCWCQIFGRFCCFCLQVIQRRVNYSKYTGNMVFYVTTYIASLQRKLKFLSESSQQPNTVFWAK